MNKYLLLIFLADGLIFLRSGILKWSSGEFVAGLSQTLARFASKNPFFWYRALLENFSIPNAIAIAWVIQSAELLVGVVVVAASLRLLAGQKMKRWQHFALSAVFLLAAGLNLNFWLASGWMSPATENLNLLMTVIELIGALWVARFLL